MGRNATSLAYQQETKETTKSSTMGVALKVCVCVREREKVGEERRKEGKRERLRERGE